MVSRVECGHQQGKTNECLLVETIMLHCHRERERDNYYNREREILQQRER